jgi:ribosomal protein S28E/S33
MVLINKYNNILMKFMMEHNGIFKMKVEKADVAIILEFGAPLAWGDPEATMPIKLNDVLIINDTEVYRIAKAEFDQTYQPINQAYAKQAQGVESIETRVEKTGGDIVLQFEAPWGGSMPIKLNDVLIINDTEVYRIAKAEFDQTYQPINQ